MAINLAAGTTDQIDWGDVNNTYDAPAALTYMYWFRRDATNLTNDATSFDKGTNVLTYHPSSSTPNGLACGIFGSVERKVTAANVFASQTWTHVAFTYTSAPTWLIYVNGVSQSLTGTDWTLGANATALIFEDNTATDTRVAHYRAWAATLTAGEILRELYSYTPVRIENLVHWNPLDDLVAGADYSGGGFTATVTGGTQVAGPPEVLHDSRARLGRLHTRSGYGRRNAFRRLGPLVPYHPAGV